LLQNYYVAEGPYKESKDKLNPASVRTIAFVRAALSWGGSWL